jgi:hypothetical protein
MMYVINVKGVTKTLEVTGDSMMYVINVKGVTKTLEVTENYIFIKLGSNWATGL